MGLFSKKRKDHSPKAADTAPEVDVHAELEALKERLAASEQARIDLETRLRVLDEFNSTLDSRFATLDGATGQLDTRLGALDRGVELMGERLATLSSSSAGLDQRLMAVDDLDLRLRELTDRLNTPMSAPPPAPTPVPPPPASISPPPPPSTTDEHDDRLDEMALQLDTLAAAVAAHTEQMNAAQVRLAEIDELTVLTADDETAASEIATLREQLTAITERMSAVDARVTGVSTELANQLTELSRDIDELNRRSVQERVDDETVDADTTEIEARLAERLDAAIDDVLDTTEKLAAEQARYEIQFRADLAELAERLRRPGAS